MPYEHHVSNPRAVILHFSNFIFRNIFTVYILSMLWKVYTPTTRISRKGTTTVHSPVNALPTDRFKHRGYTPYTYTAGVHYTYMYQYPIIRLL